MIARCAIRSGSAASPRSAGIIPGATVWKVNLEQTGEKRNGSKQQML